jgi:hypothetical protein
MTVMVTIHKSTIGNTPTKVRITQTLVPLPKHRLNRNLPLQLHRKRSPLALRPRPLILKLPINNLIRPLIPHIPNRPPRRINHPPQLRPLKHHPREIPPRPAQEIRPIGDFPLRTSGEMCRSVDRRLVDHVPAVVVQRAAGGRDPAVGRDCAVVLGVRQEGHDADVALFEPGAGALAEDEIRGAFDVGFGVELAADVGEEGVLVAVEGAGVVGLFLGGDEV